MLDKISDAFTNVFRNISGKSSISEKNVQDAMEEIKIALLEADVNLRVVRRFINRCLKDATGEQVLKAVSPGQQFVKVVHDRMVELLGEGDSGLQLQGPDVTSVILLAGLQGAGKTTSAAKLANYLQAKKSRRVLLVAADLYRPAAIDQLLSLGAQHELEVFADKDQKDPVKLVKKALDHAKKQQFDTVIVDTSGRMHVDGELMNEIAAIHKLTKPVETLLVADSMTGQKAVDIAKAFSETIELTGYLLTKFDSDTRGGAALSLRSVTNVPVKFAGVGEKIEDLQVFHPERIASRILGMGDVVSLVEKAQEAISAEEALAMQQKMASSRFTLADYLDQFKRMRKMGGLESMLSMLPGGKKALEEQGDNDPMKYEEAIILSMTPTERENHRIIGPSRRKRIARGSGTSVHQVNQLLKRFEDMRNMLKKATKNKKYQAQMMKQLGVG